MRILLSALLALGLLGCGDDDGGTSGTTRDMAIDVDGGGSDGGGGGGGELERACRGLFDAASACAGIPGLADMVCPGFAQAFEVSGEDEACRQALVDVFECATLDDCDAEPDCTAEEMAVENLCDVVEPPST